LGRSWITDGLDIPKLVESYDSERIQKMFSILLSRYKLVWLADIPSYAGGARYEKELFVESIRQCRKDMLESQASPFDLKLLIQLVEISSNKPPVSTHTGLPFLYMEKAMAAYELLTGEDFSEVTLAL
jgi:hypothetical protein